MKRSYRQKQRAKSQSQTRQKIVEAAIELHQSKGPAATSMADIAELAQVGKVTVYRHFPDEAALTGACSGQYFERHPMPDIGEWRKIGDPSERLRRALRDTFHHHRDTEPMMSRVLAEVRDTPLMEPYNAYWRDAVDCLAAPWPVSQGDMAPLKAAIALALSFDTWRLLTRDRGLTDDQAVDLMMRLIGAGPRAAG